MPFKAGVSGNPGGRAAERQWRRALMLAVNRPVGGRKALDVIADQCVALAASGNVRAMCEIADRLDGKSAQPIESTVRSVTTISDAELIEKVTRLLGQRAQKSSR